MPTDATPRLLDAFWAESFGCSEGALRAARVTVVAHSGDFASYSGAYMLRYGPACVITVPARYVALVTEAVSGKASDDVFDAAFLVAIFGDVVERVVGPSYRGCADASDFRSADVGGARLLVASDDSALRRLAEDSGAEAWEHSSIKLDRTPIFGCYAGDELAAAGTLHPAGDVLRNVGIVTHPRFRGQGYGRAVVSVMCAQALAAGCVPHYQTLLSNAPSLAIARTLGFQQYATGLAVRLLQSAC